MKTIFRSMSIGGIILLMLCFGLWYLFTSSRAAEDTVNVETSQLQKSSMVSSRNGSTKFSINATKKDRPIYKSKQKNAAGVIEFLNKELKVNNGKVLGKNSIQGLRSIRYVDDNNDPVLKKFAPNATRDKKHFFFEQTINGKPVEGSLLAVHVENSDTVYGVNGTVVDSTQLAQQNLSLDLAKQKAVSYLQQKFSQVRLDDVKKSEEIIFNPLFVGTGKTNSNIPALKLSVYHYSNIKAELPQVAKIITVSLSDGAILQDQDPFQTAIKREIEDCSGGYTLQTTGCPTRRTEGSPVSNISDVDKTYSFIGDIYNFYSTTYQRDSYDNAGGLTTVFVRVSDTDTINGKPICPNNAFWVNSVPPDPPVMVICNGMVANDVIGHEFTHGVVSYTARLGTQIQSSTLNEAIADVFANAIDTDWTMGEDTTLGILRDFSDPSKNKPIPAPDRLFSNNYYCGVQDNGGMHVNMSVVTKAYYLMITGGQFNGCSLLPVAKDQVLAVWYQALSKGHIESSANFRSLYNGLLAGCAELYGADSTSCQQIQKSLQAVEIDQQPVGDQNGPKCTGVTAQPPSCLGSGGTTPSSTSITPTVKPTVPPITNHNNACLLGDTNQDGKVNLLDFEVWRSRYAQMGTQFSSLTGSALAIAFPSYIYPASSSVAWKAITDASNQVKIVILNPNSGPGGATDPNYTNQLNANTAKGIKSIGYVASGYFDNGRPGCTGDCVGHTKADIDTYYRLYPGIGGIFIDEADSGKYGWSSDTAGKMTNIVNYVHAKGGIAVINYGSEEYIDSLDTVGDINVTFENTSAQYLAKTFRRTGAKYFHIVRLTTASDLSAVFAKIKQTNIGYVFVTDLGDQFLNESPSGAYTQIPTIWSNVLTEVNTINTTSSTNTSTSHPQCTLTTTGSVQVGGQTSISAQCTNTSSAITAIEFYVSPQNQEQWTQIGTCVGGNSVNGSWNCATTRTWSTAGSYVVVVNAYANNATSNSTTSRGTDRCTGNTFTNTTSRVFGDGSWSDCGSSDAQNVTVSSSTSTITPAITSNPVPNSCPASSTLPAITGLRVVNSNTVQWDALSPNSQATSIDLRIDDESNPWINQGEPNECSSVKNATDRCLNLPNRTTTLYSYNFVNDGRKYRIWIHPAYITSACAVEGSYTELYYQQSSSITPITTQTPTPAIPVSTLTPMPSISSTVTPSTTPNSCMVGDANGDKLIKLEDFEIWRLIYANQ